MDSMGNHSNSDSVKRQSKEFSLNLDKNLIASTGIQANTNEVVSPTSNNVCCTQIGSLPLPSHPPSLPHPAPFIQPSMVDASVQSTSNPGSGTATPLPTLGTNMLINQAFHSAVPFFAAQQHPAMSMSSHQTNNLRSGKWFPEEESYAMILIEAFEQGAATDCTNGSTLRSYLAQKLHCAPMRISKKFAGKGIGKMVYINRKKFLDPTLAAKLQETEHTFLQAIFPVTNNVFSVPLVLANLNATIPALIMPPTTSIQQQNVLSISNPHNITNMMGVPSHILLPNQVMELYTKQLQESYLRALQQTNIESQSLGQCTSSHASVTQTSVPPQPQVYPLAVSFPANNDSLPVATVRTSETFQKVAQSSEGVVHTKTSSIPSVKSTLTVQHDMPLVTSQSFDNFHRFLGTGLSVESNNMLKQNLPQPQCNSNTNYHHATNHKNSHEYNTKTPFTSDSYALLAHESAAESSQHTNYHLQPSWLTAPALCSSSTLDIDDMLKHFLTSNTYGFNTKQQQSMSENQVDRQVCGDKVGPATTAVSSLKDFSAVTSSNITELDNISYNSNNQGVIHTTSEEMLLSPVERFTGVSNVVSSGSEPSGDSASSFSGDRRGGESGGASSESNEGSDNNNSNNNDYENASNYSDGSSGDCDGGTSDSNSVEEGPRKKKMKLATGETKVIHQDDNSKSYVRWSL